jgi:hypothetical protein
MKLPVEVVNKILGYVSDLNKNVVIMQYDPISYIEFYKINFNSEVLWDIKSIIMMKKIYPSNNNDFSKQSQRDLYKHGKDHYKAQLQKK